MLTSIEDTRIRSSILIKCSIVRPCRYYPRFFKLSCHLSLLSFIIVAGVVLRIAVALLDFLELESARRPDFLQIGKLCNLLSIENYSARRRLFLYIFLRTLLELADMVAVFYGRREKEIYWSLNFHFWLVALQVKCWASGPLRVNVDVTWNMQVIWNEFSGSLFFWRILAFICWRIVDYSTYYLDFARIGGEVEIGSWLVEVEFDAAPLV